MPRSLVPPLRPNRVHEAFGPSATAFALVRAHQNGRSAFWIRAGWRGEKVLPAGMEDILPPSQLLIADTASETDSLAAAEEALKDSSIAFVVIEVTKPLTLREGRRLQLAARAGGSMGLCLLDEGMGSNAAESRWHCTPVFDPVQADSTLMRWEIKKNKSGTLGAWHVRWNGKAHRLDVVSPAPFGPGSAGMSE